MEKKYFKNDTLRYGAGLVFAHMDVTFDGRDRFYMDGGIRGAYLSGVVAQVSLEKWIKTFEKRFYLSKQNLLHLMYDHLFLLKRKNMLH